MTELVENEQNCQLQKHMISNLSKVNNSTKGKGPRWTAATPRPMH